MTILHSVPHHMTESSNCKNCSILVTDENSICCDICNTWFHLKCTELNLKTFQSLLLTKNTTWYCKFCKSESLPSLPFHKTSERIFTKQVIHSKSYDQVTSFIQNCGFQNKCSNCSKKIQNKYNSFPCITCRSFIHKKCAPKFQKDFLTLSELKNWNCPNCYHEMYPFSDIDNHELENAGANKSDNLTHISPENLKEKFNLDSIRESFSPDPDSIINCDYYDTESLLKLKNTEISKKNMAILHTNISSLNANFEKLETLLSILEDTFSIISLTETWNPKTTNDKFNDKILPGFAKFNGLAGTTTKSGCGFYIAENINTIPREDLDKHFYNGINEFECKWLELVNKNSPNVIIASIYRHPSKKDVPFLEYMTLTLEKLRREHKTVILTGDFNLNLLNYGNNKEVTDFLDLLYSHFFQPNIIYPTRFVDNARPTLIDNIFINNIEYDPISGNLTCKITDHMPNFSFLQEFDRGSEKIKIKKRDFSKFNKIEFLEDLTKKTKNQNMEPSKDIDSIYDTLHDHFLNTINTHAPLKLLSRKESKNLLKPWITGGILASIKKKDKFYHSYVKTQNKTWYGKYKLYRDKINKLIRKSKHNYYLNYFINFKNDSKKIWSGIKSIISNKKTSPSTINLQINDQIITDQKKVSNKFNEFFINVGPELCKNIPECERHFTTFLPQPTSKSIFLTPTTDEEISALIMSLDSTKASDIYDISVKLLKTSCQYMSKQLCDIINKSFETGQFPNKLKTAYVTPVHKAGSKLIPSNYRPISILPIISKIFEKVMAKRLQDFLTINNTLFDHQYGFQPGRSTELAILDLHSKIINAFENKKVACSIFLDFAKAFDTVNHKILLKKLSHYGIRGVALKWFESYLKCRPQSVKVGNEISDILQVLCGVPQGSVLGPILFLIYINDIYRSSELLNFQLFADDTSLFLSHTNTTQLETTINEELTRVSMWLKSNKLTLNVTKSNYILFRPPQKKLGTISLKIENREIEEKAQCKYLGVILDRHMSWKPHIHYINSKLSKSIGIISKLRHNVPKHLIKSIYSAFFQPHIDYNILNWGCATETHLLPIKTSLKKVVRVMTFSDFNAHSSPLFKNLKILDLDNQILFNLGKLFWKTTHNQLPNPINDILKKVTRSGREIINTFCRTTYKERFILNTGQQNWKLVPKEIKEQPKISLFSTHYKKHLLDEQGNSILKSVKNSSNKIKTKDLNDNDFFRCCYCCYYYYCRYLYFIFVTKDCNVCINSQYCHKTANYTRR